MSSYWSEVINPGDRASAFAKEVCYQSHRNCPAVLVVPHTPGNFRGPVGFTWQKLVLQQMMDYEANSEGLAAKWTVLEEVENDGAGGKPQFFTLLGAAEAFRNLGWEIITMVADDFARSGRLPCVIDNEVNVKRITQENFHLFEAMMDGYGEALRAARLVNITGEIAVMKHSITAFCDTGSNDQLVLTWGASCVGLAHAALLLDGSKIGPGMDVVGFWEPGYRCNGGTFFTNLLLSRYGKTPQEILSNAEAMTFVKQLTTPSLCYSPTITRLVGWVPDGRIWKPLARIYGAAHITGGGLWGKFGDLLPEGTGAVLHNMPVPAEVLLRAQEWAWGTDLHLSDLTAYSTFHGACGMLLVCHEDDSAVVIAEAGKDGIKAQVVGKTIESNDREIRVLSRFREGRWLSSREL